VEVERGAREIERATKICKHFYLYSPFLVYYYSSFQKNSPISTFERDFEAIRKNEKDCKETLRRYSFRKHK
jgi:hypothetical protein